MFVNLDAAATVPLRPEVLEAMLPFLRDAESVFANPSSRHTPGRAAERALDVARESLLTELSASRVVFASSGTEANNFAIKGLSLANPRGRHILTTSLEHASVVESVRYLQRHHGFSVEYVPTDRTGKIEADAFSNLLRSDTTLVAVFGGNSEIGTLSPIEEIASLCARFDTPLHVDAVQCVGMVPLPSLATSYSLSGHKFGGPRGVGALVLTQPVDLEPVLHGGGQEFGTRSGTENVVGAIGLAMALRLALAEQDYTVASLVKLRDRLIARVRDAFPHAELTGHPRDRLPNHASFVFAPSQSSSPRQHPGGEALLVDLDRHGIAASSGSACHAGSDAPSPVLLALGYSPSIARSSVRFTLSGSFSSQAFAHVEGVLRSLVP